jgi:hypothetical protein
MMKVFEKGDQDPAATSATLHFPPCPWPIGASTSCGIWEMGHEAVVRNKLDDELSIVQYGM